MIGKGPESVLSVQTDSQKFFVTKVIDGDTIEIANGERVRLIGIDTPESRVNQKTQRDSLRSGQDVQSIAIIGKEATNYMKALLEKKTVRLEFDVTQRDKYGRLLAYVYLDDLFVNAEIVRAGYASLMTIPPNVKYSSLFQSLYREARTQRRGLWQNPTMAALSPYKEIQLGLDQ